MRFPQPGEVFGRYRIDRVLGQGAMGVVFAATDTRLDRTVALKVITGALGDNEDFLRRFHDEATVLAQLDSPYVISISDHDEIDGLPFIVTQYVDGTDLSSLLGAGPLTARAALAVCAQVARGIDDAHRSGVIHRDIKPGNVLLRHAGTPDVHAYVCDFGIARVEDTEGRTATGLVAGTWAYLAPERTQGAPASRATDLYALGCLLWACLTGRPPYAGSEIEMAIAHTQAPIPQLAGGSAFVNELNAVVARLLAKKPEDRFPDADAVRAALERLLPSAPETVLPVAAPAPGQPRSPGGGAAATLVPARGPARRRRRWPLAVAAVAVLAVIGAGAGWALWPDDDADGGSTTSSQGVTGDLDADGRGDVLVQQNRAASLAAEGTWTLTSTGGSFGEPVLGDAHDGELHLGDVDRDGRPDQIWTTSAAGDGTVGVEVVESDGDQWSTELTFGAAVSGTLRATVADLDDDGRADLALHDDAPADGQLAVEVARGEEGGFADPEQWYAGAAPGASPLTVAAADLDDDGVDDLLASSTGSGTLQLLASDGSGLVAEEVVAVDRGDYDAGVLLMARLDAEALPVPVLAGGAGLATVDPTDPTSEPKALLEPEGPVGEWLNSGGAGSRLWGATDVDGDGDDDIVELRIGRDTLYNKAFRVLVHEVDGGRVLEDPDEWGSLTCEPECEDAFVVVPPAR